jgi:hypothetical protein
MTYHVVIIFSIFLFIAVAMLATIWDMGRWWLGDFYWAMFALNLDTDFRSH